MQIYVIIVACTVFASTAVIFLVLYRSRLLNLKTIVFAMIASLVSAISLPWIYNAASYLTGGTKPSMAVAVTVSVFGVFIAVSFILGTAISRIAPQKAAVPENAGSSADNPPGADTYRDGAGNYLESIFADHLAGKNGNGGMPGQNSGGVHKSGVHAFEQESFGAENLNDLQPSDNNDFRTGERGGILPDDAGIMYMEANNLEKSVDSVENIDKMGIENNALDRGSVSIGDCIEEAFRLKESGDFEGAILYYMYALDRKPGKELTFWIVLDICVLYRALGQLELALGILDNYYDIYGDIIDISAKDEIVRNLTGAQS